MARSLSEGAKQVVAASVECAVSQNQEAVSTEHMLSALLKTSPQVSEDLLNRLGLNVPTVRNELTMLFTRGQGKLNRKNVKQTPRFKRVVAIAKRLGQSRGEERHLLWALLIETEGNVSKMLLPKINIGTLCDLLSRELGMQQAS